jgi:isoleucyl-tRNA synthetase
VHLCDFPIGDASAIDETLSVRMNLVREISSLGRQARTSVQLKVRQPLAKVEVILADRAHQPWLESHAALIAEELNVKSVEFAADAQQYVEYTILPNFKRLGPKLGKNMPKVKKLLAEADGGQLLTELKSAGSVRIAVDGDSVELDEEDLEVRLQAKSGWTAAQGHGVVVVLATELTEELLSEGLARDLVRAIQDVRKDQDCEFTDRIEIGVVTESPDVRRAVELFRDYIMQETLATELDAKPIASHSANATKIGDADVQLYVQVAS